MAADSCPNMAARLCRKTTGLASHSSSRTDTDTQAEGGSLVCVCVFVIGQAVQFMLVKAPGQRGVRAERMGGGQANGMLSHLPWVGSRSLQA